MSWQASKWAAQQRVRPHPAAQAEGYSSPATANHVLRDLAEAAHPDGSGVTMGVETIADRTQLSPRAVKGGLKLLEWNGLIARRPRWRQSDGGRTTDEITLTLASLPLESADPAPPAGADPARGQVQDKASARADAAPAPVQILHPKNRSVRTEVGTKGEPRGTRLRADWAPSSEAYQFGVELGLSALEVESEAAKFRDYWTGVPGARGLKLDWSATYRNWLRRATEGRAKYQRGMLQRSSLFSGMEVRRDD